MTTNNNKSHPIPTPLEEIPKKIYYSISEASEFTGVEPHVLRYWETKFSKLNPKRVGGNQRKYTRNDLELLYEIVHLLHFEGYTLDGAERKLKMGLNALKAERKAKEATLKAVKENADPNSLFVNPENKTNSKLQEIKTELKDVLNLLDTSG